MNNITPVVLVKNDCYFLPYCLESVAGWFDKMVIYDVGSEDGTRNILDWYINKEKYRTSFFTRFLPDCPPSVQGTFRNSMIAEAGTDWFFILDADEVYRQEDLSILSSWWENLDRYSIEGFFLKYGMFERVEFSPDLTKVYDKRRSHHRLYHRSAIFSGPHPGEAPVIEQKGLNQEWCEVDGSRVTCFHFHNTLRSPLEENVPKRISRKNKSTYHPGNLIDFQLLNEVPILRKPIENFPVSPHLERLQEMFNE